MKQSIQSTLKVKKCWHHLLCIEVISFFVTKKWQKNDENSWYWRRKSSYLLSDLRNFNEIFRKGPSYDNSKSHNKAGLQSVSRKYVFGKTKEEFKLTLSLFRVNAYLMDEISLKLIYRFFLYLCRKCFLKF